MYSEIQHTREKRRVVLRFPAEVIGEPVTYVLIKEYDIVVNILNADISHGKEGSLLVEMEGERKRLDDGLAYLGTRNVRYSPVSKNILFRQEACIHCGACASVCFSGALNMDSTSRELLFLPEKCVACELCIRACPLNLFELNFGIN